MQMRFEEVAFQRPNLLSCVPASNMPAQLRVEVAWVSASRVADDLKAVLQRQTTDRACGFGKYVARLRNDLLVNEGWRNPRAI